MILRARGLTHRAEIRIDVRLYKQTQRTIRQTDRQYILYLYVILPQLISICRYIHSLWVNVLHEFVIVCCVIAQVEMEDV